MKIHRFDAFFNRNALRFPGKWVLVMGLALLVAACGGGPEPRALETSTPQIIDFTLQRLDANVFLGPDDKSMQKLTTDAPQPAPRGSFISTDATGQGLLRGAIDAIESCQVYIFFDSGISASPCPKAPSGFAQTDTQTCQNQGTGVYKQCSRNLQNTPSAAIQIKGSWLIISYRPDMRLTLITVLEGRADVWPVTDFESYTLGDSIPLEAGQVLFTMPDDSLREIAGYPPRAPLPLDALGPIVDAADLKPWYDLAKDRAIEDEVWPQEEPTSQAGFAFVLQGAGGPLQDPRVSEAALSGVDWEAVRAVFPDGSGPAPIILTGFEGATTADFPYNPDASARLLKESGQEGFILQLVTVGDDLFYLEAAKQAQRHLERLEIRVEIVPVPLEDAENALNDLISTGQAVLWLGPDIPADWRDRVVTEGREPTPAPIPTPTRRSTPTPRPTPTFTPTSSIAFWSESEVIQYGECTILHWEVENVQSVHLDGNPEVGQGARKICPEETTTYQLDVNTGAEAVLQQVTVKVTNLPPFVIQGGGGPLNDSRVGQALMVAMDWQGLMANAFSYGETAPIFLPGLEGSTTDDYPEDIDRAVDLLMESGYSEGFTIQALTLNDYEHQQILAYVEEYWYAIGVQPEFVFTTPDQAPALLSELTANGQAAIWFGPKISFSP